MNATRAETLAHSLTRALVIVRSFAELPPVAATMDALAIVSEYVPAVTAGGALLGMGYAAIKYRSFLGKAVLTVLRKLTRRR